MGFILETGGVGNRIWQVAAMPQGLEPHSHLVDLSPDDDSCKQLFDDRPDKFKFLPGASPWPRQCSGLYSGNESKKSWVTWGPKFKHLFQLAAAFSGYGRNSFRRVRKRASVCGQTHDWTASSSHLLATLSSPSILHASTSLWPRLMKPRLFPPED